MTFLTTLAGALLVFATGCVWTARNASAQEAGTYISPSHPIQRGRAPGMKVKLISDGNKTKQYAVIFAKGDEAFSGLLDFADKYHVTSGHFTAIGALNGAVLAWFDPQKKMYREIPVNGQVEVASMIGNFTLYQGKPVLHTHMVIGHPDGTTSSGHVIEAHVFPTLEVFVTVDAVPLYKRFDPDTDLMLIDPDIK